MVYSILPRVDFGASEANVQHFARALNRWSGDIRTTTGLMEEVRDDVAIPATRNNFESQGQSSWEPLSDATYTTPRRRDIGGGPTLQVRKVLKRSVTAKARWKIQGPDLFVPGDTFVVSNAPYGRLQHEGGPSPWGSDVPARPFFYLTEADVARAEELVANWAMKNFDKRIGLKAAGTTVGSVMR